MTTANLTVSESADLLATARHMVDGLGNQRPSYVSHPVLESIVDAMRAAGRTELVNYAGASYRDDIAWGVSLAWLANPELPESELKAIALKGTPYEVSAAHIRAANPGMR